MTQQQIRAETGALGADGNLNVYVVPGSVIATPVSAAVIFDGTGAAGAFIPCLTFKTQTGAVIARCPASEVAAGATAEVSWFPSVGGKQSGPTPAGPGQLIYDYTVTAASKASIDTSSDGPYAGTLDQRFSVLEMWTVLRTDEASITSQVSMFFNHDSTLGNYNQQYIYGSNTTAHVNNTVAPPGFDVVGANADAGYAAIASTVIPAYSQTYYYKQAVNTEARNDSDANSQIALTNALGWRNTAAITRIELVPFAPATALMRGSRLMILAN